MKAQLAQEIASNLLVSYIDRDDWWIEQKLDGFRMTSEQWKRGPIMFKNRNDAALSKIGIQEARELREDIYEATFSHFIGNRIFDGEFVDGLFYVFDCIRLAEGGIPQITEPYFQRRADLETVFTTEYQRLRLLPVAKTPEDKATLCLQALNNGCEGVMLKRVDAPYFSGERVAHMLKVKFTKRLDAVITEVRLDGKNNAQLSLVAGSRLVPIGRCSLNGKPPVDPGDVVEVEYLYASDDSRLVQPRLIRVREDKTPAECQFDQLQYTSRTIIPIPA